MNLIKELNRRNVTRVALAYAVASWVLIEVTSVVAPAFAAPEWVLRVLIIMLVTGFPLALIFSWVYELTPDGLRKESEISGEQSITGHTAKKLNVVVIVLLLVAIGLFVFDRFFLERPSTVGNPVVEQGATGAAPGQDTGEPAIPSLAVLAFENMSADAENEYFADGISEEILNLLADVSSLSVASRTSAFAFKGKDTPIPEIASALNVRYVLEGSVRKSGEQVRVTAQLIDANTDRHLWSETFDRTLEDIFSIQDEIAASIGQALQIQLLGAGGHRVKAEAVNPEAYAMFLEARHLLRSRTRDAVRAANEMLIRVVGAEPGFARAHVVLGEAYLLNVLSRSREPLLPDDLALLQARMHAEVARMLNPGLSGIDLIIGSISERSLDQVKALEHFGRAIETEPSEPRPYHWRGNLLGRAGYIDECQADLKIALRLDPDNVGVNFGEAACKFSNNDIEAALEQVRSTVERVPDTNVAFLIFMELANGKIDSAVGRLRRFALHPDEDPLYWNAVLEAIQSPAVAGVEVPRLPMRNGAYEFGIYLALGRKDEFLENLQLAEGPHAGMALTWWPGFSGFRNDPRFVLALERFGIVDIWRLKGPPPDCRVSGDSYTCGHLSDPQL